METPTERWERIAALRGQGSYDNKKAHAKLDLTLKSKVKYVTHSLSRYIVIVNDALAT